ncbi:50S ribosomal protein L25 [Patescibacteria group bacterium]|nr:MAG: 50S ribosomal protein L25 [Patescibacteria group bacterium]
MDSLLLAVSRREKTGKAAKHLLTEGKIPAVIYGHGVTSSPVQVERAVFDKVYRAAGGSTLVDLKMDEEKPVKVLISEVSFDPLKDTVNHIDFLAVNMQEKLKTEIPLKFFGEAPAVKGLGGTLVKNLSALAVECLPADLVHEIPVDLGRLAAFADAIRVRDIAAPHGISFLDQPDEVVTYVEAPRSEEELKALEGKTEVSVEGIEVVTKKKEEEEAEPAAEKATE